MKRRKRLQVQVERMARQGTPLEHIARRVRLDRRQVQELLRQQDFNGKAPGR